MRNLVDKKKDLMTSINNINMGDTVMSFLLNISSKTDLSPKGFIAMLSFIHDSIANEYKTFMQKIFKVSHFISSYHFYRTA